MQKIISLFQRNYDGDRLNSLSDAELGYIAGIIDGEGSFYIYLKSGGKSGRKYHRSALKIANTDTTLIQWLYDRIGGTIATSTPKKENHKIVYHLAVEGPRLVNVINLLSPYLIIKRAQAEVVKSMQETMTYRIGFRLTDEMISKRDSIYRSFVLLKHGPSMTWANKKLA